MFNFLMSCIIFFVGFRFFYIFYIKFSKTISFSKEIKDLNKSMSNWYRVNARIESVEVFCDYDFPGMIPDSSGIEGPIAKENFEIEFNKKISQIIDKRITYGNVNITYVYRIEGKKIKSRSIGLYPGDYDLEIAKKLSPGKLIKVYVNPSDLMEVYIRKINHSELNNILNRMFIANIKNLVLGLVICSFSIISYSYGFIS